MTTGLLSPSCCSCCSDGGQPCIRDGTQHGYWMIQNEVFCALVCCTSLLHQGSNRQPLLYRRVCTKVAGLSVRTRVVANKALGCTEVAYLNPASSFSSASRSSRRVVWFQMSPAWRWSRKHADQNAGQLPRRPPLLSVTDGGGSAAATSAADAEAVWSAGGGCRCISASGAGTVAGGAVVVAAVCVSAGASGSFAPPVLGGAWGVCAAAAGAACALTQTSCCCCCCCCCSAQW